MVSHRSAALVLGLGDLVADFHEFTFTTRRQTRRPGVRLHVRPLAAGEWHVTEGLPVTRPSRLVADLLLGQEDPSAVATIAAEALRQGLESAQTMAAAVAPHALRYGLALNDGQAMVDYLLTAAGTANPARDHPATQGR